MRSESADFYSRDSAHTIFCIVKLVTTFRREITKMAKTRIQWTGSTDVRCVVIMTSLLWCLNCHGSCSAVGNRHWKRVSVDSIFMNGVTSHRRRRNRPTLGWTLKVGRFGVLWWWLLSQNFPLNLCKPWNLLIKNAMFPTDISSFVFHSQTIAVYLWSNN